MQLTGLHLRIEIPCRTVVYKSHTAKQRLAQQKSIYTDNCFELHSPMWKIQMTCSSRQLEWVNVVAAEGAYCVTFSYK